MSSFEFISLTIIGCAIVTWISRVLPFILLKKMSLPQIVVEYLSFVPVVIMSALWISNLFIQHLGHLPSVNWNNLFASIPTIIAAVLTKNLLIIVIVGVLSLALIQLAF
ncbi:AzlD domain-containing protein [Lactococcus lactis]|uniref:AzlD domain-containing protein n=1 Tax=Lactococcus lactis TaxID=1358 RepID=UPI001F52BF89|nr:AzlD domain-containing protein [Lactococcus lactis]